MIGGPDSFGAGGYLDTPVEKALPVDMDIKQRKVMPKGTLVLILHTVEFPDGNAWAAEIAIAALNVLSAQDLMGGLGYLHSRGDSWIFNMSRVGNKVAIRNAIRQGSTQIGDMPSVDGTLRLAYGALTSGEAGSAAAKRILIISDGDPAPPTARLVKQIKDAGISVSTVVINPHSPNDLNMMEGLAKDTGGAFYHPSNPNVLPQIFMKEASIVKRGMIIEDPFEPKVHHESELLYGLAESAIPSLNGYVVTTPKDEATIPLVSHEGDPILAHFRYGLGKSVAFTSDATNRWATDWLAWEGFDRFWAQTVRWVTRDLTPTNFRVETSVQNGRGQVRVDAVDKEGNFINFLRPKGVVTSPAPDFESFELALNQSAPGIYEASFPLGQNGVYMINLLYTREDGTQGSIPAGLSLGYSPEYEYTNSNVPLLEQIALAGGGQVAAAGYNPFIHDLIATPAVTPIWHVLALLAICLFPIEIFVRRVVIPMSVVTDPIVRLLKRLPALGSLIPAPPTRPVAVTGTYSASVEARDFDGPAMEGAPAFGQTEAASPSASAAGQAASPEPSTETAQDERSGYTGQLLAAKERAIARKTRRISSLDEKNKR
jgi:uncharacterized membrane protein